MEYILSEEEVVKRKFIFISYKHENKAIVEKDLMWFAENGVRFWYDTNLLGGDNWEARVSRVMHNENCCGVFFYCSPEAFMSEAIYFEREVAIKEREERGEENFFIMPINITKPTTLQIMQQTFNAAPTDAGALETAFAMKKVKQIAELFNPEIIYRYADQSNREQYLTTLLSDLKSLAPLTIDSSEMRLNSIQRKTGTKFGLPYFSLGLWLSERVDIPGVPSASENGVYTVKNQTYILLGGEGYLASPLKWFLLWVNGGKATLMCDTLLRLHKAGPQLNAWLNETFVPIAFDKEVLSALEAVRLLKESEYKELKDTAFLSNPYISGSAVSRYWWIDGRAIDNNQKVVKTEDGTLYRNGVAKNQEIGVRPVVEISFEKLSSFLEG